MKRRRPEFFPVIFTEFSLTWSASTKESFYVRKESNPHRIDLEHQNGRRENTSLSILENRLWDASA